IEAIDQRWKRAPEGTVGGVDVTNPDDPDTDNGVDDVDQVVVIEDGDTDDGTVVRGVVTEQVPTTVAQRAAVQQQLPRTGPSMLTLLVTALMALAFGGSLLRTSSAKPAASAAGRSPWTALTSPQHQATQVNGTDSTIRSAEAGRTRSTRPWTHGA
ncbi:MAG: hypothetical protein WD010_05915, partial [Nitriliruptor sp.]